MAMIIVIRRDNSNDVEHCIHDGIVSKAYYLFSSMTVLTGMKNYKVNHITSYLPCITYCHVDILL